MKSLMSFALILPKVPKVPKVPGVLLLLVVTAGAQTTPDFSGDWVMTSLDAAVDVPLELRVRQEVESGVQVLRVDRRGVSGTQSAAYRIGIEGGFVTGTRQTRSSARWIGQQLVIRQGDYAGPLGENAAFKESEEAWSLDASGRLLITAITRERDVASKTTQTTYRRR